MSYMDEFNFWLNDDYFDQATKDELLAIRNNEGEIEERFYKELEFGTSLCKNHRKMKRNNTKIKTSFKYWFIIFVYWMHTAFFIQR